MLTLPGLTPTTPVVLFAALIVPVTCEPWPQVSLFQPDGWPPTDVFELKSSCAVRTPESITHTVTPVPSAPAAHACGAPTIVMPYGVVCAIGKRWTSSSMYSTCGL